MCDCLQSAATIANHNSCNRLRKSGVARCSWNIKPVYLASEILTGYKDCSVTNKLSNRKCTKFFRHEKLFTHQRVMTILGVFGSNAFDMSSELRLKERGDEHFALDLENGEEKLEELELDYISDNESSDDSRTHNSLKREKGQNGEFGILNFDEPLLEEGKERVLKAEDMMAVEDKGKNDDLELEADQVEELLRPKSKPKRKLKGKPVSKSRNQLMKRSSILAKQVIGIDSACNLGFISQLWVDTSNWTVLEVEVRPNLLSSESGRFLLEDINKVGDVVLLQEENYLLSEFRTVGLETLVGYNVVTPGQKTLGKVRGYTFNINSGTVESLELDAFGYSIIPSSLVSTYALFTEDVLDVVSDFIIVHEAAASRIQRLTKGFLGTRNSETLNINLKHRELDAESTQPVKDRKPRRKKSSKQKFYPGIRDLGKDFELPMDYM